MTTKKHVYLLLAFASVLLFIIIAIMVATLQSPSVEEPEPTTFTTPIPTPVANQGVPPVSYKSDDTDRLIDKVQNRQSLSPQDVEAKQKILLVLPLGAKYGYVFESETVRLEYLSSPDVFMAEILTQDIAKAKTDAVTWFRSQGLSKEGVCNLPISFYINYDVAQLLRDKNIAFSPLAEGC